MVLAGMGAPCPSGVSATHRAAPPGTWHRAGMGGTGSCVPPVGLGCLLCTGKVGDSSCAHHCFVCRGDVLRQLLESRTSSGARLQVGAGARALSSPRARLGVSTCLRQNVLPALFKLEDGN